MQGHIERMQQRRDRWAETFDRLQRTAVDRGSRRQLIGLMFIAIAWAIEGNRSVALFDFINAFRVINVDQYAIYLVATGTYILHKPKTSAYALLTFPFVLHIIAIVAYVQTLPTDRQTYVNIVPTIFLWLIIMSSWLRGE